MNNYKQPGKILTLTAPSGGVVSGSLYLIAGLPVVAAISADAGDEFQGVAEGVVELAKTTSQAWAEGQPAYWDAANSKVSTDPTVGAPIGAVAAAAGSDDTTGDVRLNGTSLTGRLFSVRKRFTIAQINAGATLVPAVPGAKIRMVDAFAIAYGGAVGGTTTVDILGTVTTGRKLVAFGQANLTQSTLVRAGGTGGTVLADGASFTPNDAGAAVTVGKTGNDLTTATGVDVHFTYSLE